MIDTSATATRHWQGSSRAGSVFRVCSCQNFVDRKLRGGGCLGAALLLCAFVLVFAAAQSRGETTLYVGKHFEVRDHDQPTKYVFNGRNSRKRYILPIVHRAQAFRLLQCRNTNGETLRRLGSDVKAA
jgi:hypothetical protein